MSVPLDRLYNFLHDVCDRDDIIIYRFFPHGSRKIEDLSMLTDLRENANITDARNIFVFCNDQEPLNFNLYQNFDISIFIKKIEQYLDEEFLEKCKSVCQRVNASMNLKWVAGLVLWKAPALLVHSEQRSKELSLYEQIEFISVYWWSHALIARDWFRYAEYDPMLDKKNIQQDFLIYNRAWAGTREYRIKFAELLVDYNLSDYCLTWFSKVDNGQHYLDHSFKNPDFQSTNKTLPQIFKSSTANSDYSADYNNKDYCQTRIEVVLETLFDDSRLHLTEKSLRPIACGQPFMLAATHGSLEYLRGYGFETFSPWIDETYDTIENPAQRLEAIVQEMRRIADLSEDEKTVLYAKLKTIAAKNKQLFFSDDWQKRIVAEFETNVNAGFKKLADLNSNTVPIR